MFYAFFFFFYTFIWLTSGKWTRLRSGERLPSGTGARERHLLLETQPFPESAEPGHKPAVSERREEYERGRDNIVHPNSPIIQSRVYIRTVTININFLLPTFQVCLYDLNVHSRY
jgi:hypothetical protein